MFCCFKTLFYSARPISRYSPRVDDEKQERLRLDIYSGRENLGLIGVPETGEGMEAANPQGSQNAGICFK